MAIQPRISRLRLDDAATHATNVLEWIATAAIQDTPAGASVVVTITRATAGAPPGNPATLTLRYTTDTGVVIRTVALDTAAASQSDTFFFTHDGTSGGTPRLGTVEIKLQATRTDVVAYDVETDGTPNTPPTGFDSHLDRGWIRSSGTAQTSMSNVTFGGAVPTVVAYDDSIYHRIVLSAIPYKSETLNHLILPDSQTSTSTSATATFDRQFANVADNRFPATQVVERAAATAPNSALTGQPWMLLTEVTEASLTFDVRLRTVPHLLQINDSVYGTPPSTKNDPDSVRKTSELGFLSFRIINARAEGVNGLALSEELRDVAQLLQAGDYPARTGVSTTTRGGEAGWASTFMTWPDSLPEGVWVHKTTLTTPDTVGLDVNNVHNYTLEGLSVKPRFDALAFATSGGKTISFK